MLMKRDRPKTITLPQDQARQRWLRRYIEVLKSELPTSPFITYNQLAVIVEFLLLTQLFAEGQMINIDTFIKDLTEQNPALAAELQKCPWLLDEACIDLADKIAKSRTGSV